MIPNDLERMWKEEAVSYLKSVFQYFPGKTDKNHENLRKDSRSPEPPGKGRVLLTTQN
jgi:hypothetical protein